MRSRPQGGTTALVQPKPRKEPWTFFGHYEQSQQTADIENVDKAFIQDVPSIVSFLRVDMFAYNTDLKNYHPNNLTPFDNMMNVDI